MTEYWVSTAKFFCKYCSQWIADNKVCNYELLIEYYRCIHSLLLSFYYDKLNFRLQRTSTLMVQSINIKWRYSIEIKGRKRFKVFPLSILLSFLLSFI